MLAADRAAANNKYAASKAEGFKNGGVVIDSSYYRFLLKGLIDSNHEFRRKLDEEEEASRREYTNLPEDRKELVAPPNFEYAYLLYMLTLSGIFVSSERQPTSTGSRRDKNSLSKL
jgi:hypothetical protein